MYVMRLSELLLKDFDVSTNLETLNVFGVGLTYRYFHSYHVGKMSTSLLLGSFVSQKRSQRNEPSSTCI